VGTIFAFFPRHSRFGIKRELTASRGPRGGLGGREGISTSKSVIRQPTRGARVTFANIFAFVLAFAALISVAVLWLTSLRRQLELESWRATVTSNFRQLAAKLATADAHLKTLKQTAPAGLAAQVVELSDAVARLAKTQQRFAGKFYAQGADPVDAAGSDRSYATLDPELAAELALQSAPPVAPGKGS